MIKNIQKNKFGFVALIFVIMISSIFIVSSVIIAMVNTSNNMANYHSLESDEVMYNIDACLSDAMWQIASTTNAMGDYSIALDNINCAYQISATTAGLKTVTSTATTTSDLGSWNRSVVMKVNVSSSPFLIQSHKDYIAGTCLNNSCCGDSICNAGETCGTCSGDCGECPVPQEDTNYPSSGTNNGGGDGYAWTNPGNILLDDAVYAEYLTPEIEDSSYYNYEARLVKEDGSYTLENKELGSPWLVGIASYGGQGDLWTESWTPADINDIDFGFVIMAEGVASSNYLSQYLKASNFGFDIPLTATITGIKVEVDENIRTVTKPVPSTWAQIDYIRITVYYED